MQTVLQRTTKMRFLFRIGVRFPIESGPYAYHNGAMKIGKRESQRLEKRAQIIAVARQYFFEHGYENTTMSAIAAAIGGSKRTLWSYFDDKEALFEAMLLDTAQGIRAQIDLPTGEGDPVERLTRLCRSAIDRALSPMAVGMFRLIGPLADRRPDISRLFYDRGPAETQRMIGNYLRDNFADVLWTDDFRSAGIDLVAFSTAEMHFERMWGLSMAPTPAEREARARRGAMLFLRAYARDPETLVPRAELAAAPA